MSEEITPYWTESSGKEAARNSYIIPLLPNLTRIEVIKNGREFVYFNKNSKIEISVQDNGRTIKFFIYE